MDCQKAQRLIHDLGNGASLDVQRHVSECSDCRVTQQRALHLQQLLAIKRHENPGPHYFDNFLSNFHNRLAQETAPQPTVWQRVLARLHIEPAPRLRYGFTHALGVAFAVTLMWRGLVATDLPVNTTRSVDNDSLVPELTTSGLPAPHSTPRMIASALPSPTVPPASAFLMPAAALRDMSAPRYILDRISLSPASYELASIHF
ncbi:MAG: hypothetical protein WCS70_13600 [Verrucomicrobiota bacterium]